MNQFRFLALPGYALGVFLLLMPLIDTLVSAWPPRPGVIGWRFGAVGLYSNAFLTPLVGVILLLVLAKAMEHRKVIRLLSILTAIAAVFVLGALAVFILDALQMRAAVRAEAKTTFDRASALAMVKYLVTAVILALFSVKSWQASRRTRTPVVSSSLPLVSATPEEARSL
jgi:MFS family permease